MRNSFPYIFFLLSFCAQAQIQFSEKQINLGNIVEAYEIKGNIVLTNTSAKKIFLMRADADKGVKIYTSKKTLLSNDTALLIISFIPEEKGRFNKRISLVSSDQTQPYELNLSGNLSKVKYDDKTACYYFGSRKAGPTDITDVPMVISEPIEKRDNSNKIPDKTVQPVVTPSTQPVLVVKEKDPKLLSETEFKPNNILFLVDVSGSMKDSLKLPLMKNALHILVDAVRAVDRITFVTYADSIKIIKEGISGADKKTLHELVSGLKARGLTKGNKAILFSQQVAQKHFITGGNNQIFLATDGKFRFYSDDFNTWLSRQQDKKIILSAVAFGNKRDAMKNLKEIAGKCGGSFIHIKRRLGSEDELLDEVKDRSKIR